MQTYKVPIAKAVSILLTTRPTIIFINACKEDMKSIKRTMAGEYNVMSVHKFIKTGKKIANVKQQTILFDPVEDPVEISTLFGNINFTYMLVYPNGKDKITSGNKYAPKIYKTHLEIFPILVGLL